MLASSVGFRRVSMSERHARAREQSIGFMAEAARHGDYLDALQWLNTLASVDMRFTATAETILATWRARAQRFRRGDGTSRTVEFSAQLLAGDQLLLTIVRDISDR